MSDQSFRGHPKQLFFLVFSDAWERFSYYGMTALLEWLGRFCEKLCPAQDSR